MQYDTLPKLFLDKVTLQQRRTALREKRLGIWRPISWNEYYDHVEAFGLGLKKLGLRRSEKVSILGDNCPEWLYADLAVQSLQGISVGIYPTNSSQQVKYVLENSESVYVIVKDQEQLDKVLDVKSGLPLLRGIIVIDMKGVRKYTDPLILSYAMVEELGRSPNGSDSTFKDLINQTEPDDIAVIVYTSGTTGPPKGAMLSHKNIRAAQDAFLQVLPMTHKDSLVCALPLCHVAERLFSLFLAMKVGCTVNFAESVATMQADMIEIAPTIFLTVPRILEKIHSSIIIKMQNASLLKRWLFNRCIKQGAKITELKISGMKTSVLWRLFFVVAYFGVFRALKNRIGLLQVRECVSGAAPLSKDVIKFFRSMGLEIKEAYGCTESTGIISMPKGKGSRLGSVGKPIPGIDFRLETDGEILISGDLVFEGYYNDPEGTAKVKKGGWVYTGDVGRLDEHGYLYITDRKKEILINSAGKNIAPSEIENKLKFSAFIDEAIVIGEGRNYLTALIQIDYENVANWAQKQDIPFTNYKSLVCTPKVRELIEQEIRIVNQSVSRAEQIKHFTILDKQLDRDDNELTATMKVKRSIIEKKFKDVIEAMYEGK